MPTIVHGDFEWDDEKARKNVEKHGVTFEEAVLALGDHFAFEFGDDGNPENSITLAAWPPERILYVVSTIRGERIRIISARNAIKSERKRYDHQR